ncbi:MAG: beta-propeller fold lactonase family protein [Vulcanimicrobiota bacterium]
MRHQLCRLSPCLLILSLLSLLAGCSSSSIQEFPNLPPPGTLIISADLSQLTVGEKSTFTALLEPGGGEVHDVTELVTWSSSAPTVAAAPGADGLLTALAPGTTEIQATLSGLTSNSLSINVDLAVTSLRIEDGGVTFRGPGGTVGYRAIATLADNSELDITSQATWASDKPEVSIDSAGLATVSQSATGGTEATISATYQGKQDHAMLTINQFLFSSNLIGNSLSRWIVNSTTGELTDRFDTSVLNNPSLLALSPNGRFMYLTHQVNNRLTAFEIDPSDGTLTELLGSPYATGDGPFQLAVDPQGRFLAVTNITDDTVTIFALSASTGIPTLLTTLDASLGLGERPHAVAFHPILSTLYVSNADDNTISTFSYTSSGDFSALETPISTGGNPVGIGIHPSGNFLYASNYNSNTISGYKIEADGTLAELNDSPYTAGINPQFQGFHPSGAFAFIGNIDSNNLHTYRIETSGALTHTSTVSGIERPRGIAVSGNGNFLYQAADLTSQVFAFAIDTSTGALNTTVPNSPYLSGNRPWGLVLTP